MAFRLTAAVVGACALFGLSCVSPQPERLRPAMVAISVRDLEATSRWYCERLGFKPRASLSWPEHGVRTQILHIPGFDLELISRDGSRPLSSVLPDPEDPTLLQGIKKFALVTPGLDALFHRLSSSGVSLVYPEIRTTRLGQRFFMVEDPEGNIIQFFEAASF